jgi:hypothetical protein
MTQDIGQSQIRDWLDDDLLEQIERVESREVEYNFRIVLSGLSIHVIKRQQGGPIIITSTVMFSEAGVSELSDSQQNHLMAQLQTVLTNAPGFYLFKDSDLETVDFEDMEGIEIQHRVYPDEASQHLTMNGIIDVMRVLVYTRDTIANMISNIEQQR